MARTSSLMAFRRVSTLPSKVAIGVGLDNGFAKLIHRQSSSSTDKKPTLESVKVSMQTIMNSVFITSCTDTKLFLKNLNVKPNGLSNEALVIMASLSESLEARRELLIRHVMDVDNVEYEEALKTCKEIEAKAREGLFLTTIPYKVGIFTALATGFGSIPMVRLLNF